MAEVQAGALAPAAPVAPATEVAPAPASTADQVTESPEGGDKPVAPERTFTQSELDAINARTKAQADRRALKAAARVEAERDLYRQQLEELRGKPASQSQPQQSGEPNVNDFKDYEEYLLAKAEWRYEQKQTAKQREERTQTAEQRDRDFAVGLAKRLHEKFEAVSDEIPEIIELVRGSVPFTEPMVTYIDESNLGAKVAHFLATNVKEAARIAQLGPATQVRELDKIEAKLAAPPKASTAPSPIVPGGTNASARKGWKDMDTAEHVSAWLNRKKRR